MTLKNDIIKAFKSIKMNQKVKFKIYDHTLKLEDDMGVGNNRDTAQKMKFTIENFFSKCDQICSFLRIR